MKTYILKITKQKNFYPYYTKTKMAETKKEVKTETKAVKPVAAKATPVKATPVKAAAAKKVNKDEMVQKHQQMVQFVQNLLGSMENDMKRIKLALNQLAKFDPEDPESVEHKDAEQTM